MHFNMSDVQFTLQSGDFVIFDIPNNQIRFMRINNIYFTIGGTESNDNENIATKSPWLYSYQADAFMHIISVVGNCKYREESRTETQITYLVFNNN